jgi:hypothetical protein
VTVLSLAARSLGFQQVLFLISMLERSAVGVCVCVCVCVSHAFTLCMVVWACVCVHTMNSTQ